MSYYITRYGRILQYGGRITDKKEQKLDTSTLGFENKFEDKERAIYFRDMLREQHPRLFLKQPNITPTKTMNKKSLSQDDFREQMRLQVSQHLDEFWTNLSQLKPRDYVDGFIKAAAYGFSRAPTEKELDDEDKMRQQQQEQQRKQQLMERGIVTEDMEE